MSDKPYRLAVRAVIVNEQGQCLLLRRSCQCRNFVGKWEWPGGKVDEGEPFDDALRREVREETGLVVEPLDVIGAYGFEMASVRLAVLCLRAKLAGGDFRLSDEHDGHRWVPAGELSRCELIPGLEKMAELYAASAGG